jgi:protein-S-isoprenylcysteine O-methyltransferase Ste14
LVFGVTETLIATFFILRVPPRRVSQKLSEWIVAGLGTFLPLLLRATLDETNWFAEALLLAGSLLQVAAIVSINRSFALVPALRELKTDGAYRFVRHPIYASYVVSLSGFLWANYSLENLVVTIISLVLMIWRIRIEESLLEQTSEYRRYRELVRWRLLPGVW